MRNTSNNGTEAALISALLAMLKTRMPPSWQARLGPRSKTKASDAVVSIDGPDGSKAQIVVETKRWLDPKEIPSVLYQARAFAKGRPLCIVSTFLSPTTQERLREAGVSYLDTYGNVRFVLDRPAIFIETAGAEKGPKRRDQALSSLKGRAAGRVVRALCDFKPPYGVRELADRSETALGSVARVIELLDKESLIERDARGQVAGVDWARLIRRWTQDYSLTESNETKNFLEPRGLKSLNKKLRALTRPYAVTGSLALAGKPVIAPALLAVVYVDDIEAAASELGLHTVDAGANVILARPFDPVVYDRGVLADGVRAASASQVAADLLTSPGRGPAEAEELIRWMEGNIDGWRS